MGRTSGKILILSEQQRIDIMENLDWMLNERYFMSIKDNVQLLFEALIAAEEEIEDLKGSRRFRRRL